MPEYFLNQFQIGSVSTAIANTVPVNKMLGLIWGGVQFGANWTGWLVPGF